MQNISSQRLQAIRQLKCPRCFTGPVFNGLISMHSHCPHCGLLYNREQGFFVGALYLSYGMGIPVLLASMVLTGALLHLDFFDTFWYALIGFLPFTPLLFRYSRVIWLHLIEHYDPLPIEPHDIRLP